MHASSPLLQNPVRTAAACPRSGRPGPAVPHRWAGQGMTEYLIVVALIAVAAIGVYSLLGQTLRSQTAGLALEVSGQDAGAAIGAAQGQAGAAQASAATRKGLANYNEANR